MADDKRTMQKDAPALTEAKDNLARALVEVGALRTEREALLTRVDELAAKLAAAQAPSAEEGTYAVVDGRRYSVQHRGAMCDLVEEVYKKRHCHADQLTLILA